MVKPADLKQRKREVGIAEARQVAMYLLCMTSKYTLTYIGQQIGGRSPATVSHAFQKIAGKINNDPALKRKVDDAWTLIKGD